MKIAFTGHRTFTDLESKCIDPEALFRERLCDRITQHQLLYSELTFVTGAALGVDTWAATFAMNKGISLHLFLPFPSEIQMEKSKMTLEQCKMFHVHMEYAESLIVVNQKFSLSGYGKRNRALVDNSDVLWSFYTRKRSGTGHCVRYYVKEKGRPSYNLKTQSYDSGTLEN